MSTQCAFCKTRSTLQSGFTLVELLIVIAVIGIVSAISVPAMLRARRAGNEAAAIGSLRALNSAESSYAAAAGKGGFSPTLATLAASCPGSTAGFISPDLGTNAVVKSGYTVTLADGAGAVNGRLDCNGVQSRSAFYATAAPLTFGSSGNRAFAIDAGGTVFQETASGTPPPEPLTEGGTISAIN